jgi:hypothetical protein
MYCAQCADDKYRLAAYSNANACLMFLPLILVWESDILVAHAHMFFSLHYWGLLLLSGVGGFAIGIVTMLQIQVDCHWRVLKLELSLCDPVSSCTAGNVTINA